MVDGRVFIELLRRASHSKYSVILMHNRMLMQCYSIGVDSEVGLHWACFIPDTEEYQDDFYNQTMILTHASVIKEYSNAFKEVEILRKSKKIKPKDLKVEAFLQENAIKFTFTLQDELIATAVAPVQYPVSESDTICAGILDKYDQLLSMVKPGGMCLQHDGIQMGLIELILNCPEIYFYKEKCGNKSIMIPLAKSLFAGMQKLTKFVFSIQETTKENIYILTIHLGKNNIEEIFWGYIINF